MHTGAAHDAHANWAKGTKHAVRAEKILSDVPVGMYSTNKYNHNVRFSTRTRRSAKGRIPGHKVVYGGRTSTRLMIHTST